MNWTLAVQLALLTPMVAALGALALAGTTGERTFPGFACLAGAGFLAAGAVAASTGEETMWRRFDVNAWSGMLGAGALLCAAAACLRPGGAAKRAAVALAGGVAVASLLSPDRAWFGVLVATTTLAHGVALAAEGRFSRTRSRAFAIDAASAGLIVLGLAMDASDSLAFGDIDGWAGNVVVAGGLLRLGVFGWPEGTVWPVAMRAQGAFVCAMAGLGEAGLVAPAAVAAGLATVRLWARPSGAAVEASHMALIALGLGVGGSVAVTGAALLLAAAFAMSAVRLSGATTLARPLLSPVPWGAFLGTALVAGAVGRLAAVRMQWLWAAIPALTAACVAVAAAWRIEQGEEEPASRSTAVAILPALGVLGLMAFVPAFALDRAAGPLSAAAGAAPSLGFTAEALTETLGYAVAALALVGLLAGGVGATPVVARAMPPSIPESLDEAQTADPGVWGPAARLAGAAMLAFAVWLTLSAGNRGWL